MIGLSHWLYHRRETNPAQAQPATGQRDAMQVGTGLAMVKAQTTGQGT